jgi:hypothetical protein
MQYRASRQEVTGLVVNQKINVRREYRHNVRAMVHSLIKTGSFQLYGAAEKGGAVIIAKRNGSINELQGMLGFIDSVDVHNHKSSAEPGPFELASKELMYKQFLIYKDFYSAQSPVIICEGGTDNIYLTHAIRSLAAEFPELAEITQEGKKRLKIRLYKYPQSSTARILGLGDGGSGVLNNFIATYTRETDRFTAPGLKNPVIIFYDNDSGAKPIRAAIGNASKKKVKGTEPFVHVVKNMYAVATPLLNGAAESKVEDFFDDATRQIVINGKAFHSGNDFDTADYYGKKVFAHRVVAARAESINFAGFRPVLTNFSNVIKAHAAAVSGKSATV